MTDELPSLRRELLEIAAAVLEADKPIYPNSRLHKWIIEELAMPEPIDCGLFEIKSQEAVCNINLDDGLYKLTALRIGK